MRLTDKPRTLSDMRPNVAWPAEVQAVLDRALQRDASQRYQSAADFGRDLLRAMRTLPESAVAEGATQVMGATAVLSEVPATRVARSSSATVAMDGAAAAKPAPKIRTPSTSSAAPAGSPKRKMPVAAIAAGLVIVLGGGVAALAMRGKSPTPAAADSATVIPAGKPAAATAAPVQTAAAPSGASVSFMLDRLEPLTDPERGANEKTADSALKQVNALDPQISNDEDLVHATVLRAEALLTLGKADSACHVLADIEGKSKKTQRANRVAGLLRTCQ